ncbi:hypothetical protein H5410_063910 [Solanum commersonii]|uniref:Reverse transcriptase domain-containing protein n=1 Tax=Solanum commersonii TaxID=4109 RepID=A0A9J5WGR3_SOLCO|nr:hypothetical protein H5410_063910 [Solanum commersonii]
MHGVGGRAGPQGSILEFHQHSATIRPNIIYIPFFLNAPMHFPPRTIGGDSEHFPVEMGLHQGSVLSPFLFALVMDELVYSGGGPMVYVICG